MLEIQNLTGGYTMVILKKTMKTAISLPDELYAAAERTAQALGIPRSQLFARALEEFIHAHQKDEITERLNKVYSQIQQNDFEDISSASLESLRELTKNDTW